VMFDGNRCPDGIALKSLGVGESGHEHEDVLCMYSGLWSVL
jgi:hypothetical protein